MEQLKESNGLSSQEAQTRLKADGENVLAKAKRKPYLYIFFGQYKDIMTLILLACTVISLFLGDYFESIAIAVIVLINGFLGFIQEFKTEKSLESLKKLSAATAKVYRDNTLITLDTSQLVKGDVIVLEAGDKIPADCLVLSNTSLSCQEAILTGESAAVNKQESSLLDYENKLNRKDMVYMGCVVTSGRAKCLIINTGMDTQMGKIAHLLKAIEEEATPLSKKLDQLSKFIAVGCILICFIISFTGWLKGEAILDMLITGVSLAVAAVPEGLAAIVTISLALAVMRMSKQNAIVRQLHAVETLGCATVICSDKTGTLTENKMTLTKYFTLDKSNEGKSFDELLKACVLCNNIEPSGLKKDFIGNPTEIALYKFYQSHRKAPISHTRISEIPFSSLRKCMSVSVKIDNKSYTYIKGAVDVVLKKCTHTIINNVKTALSDSIYKSIIKANEDMSNDALRCLCLAYKENSDNSTKISEDNFVFIGLVGIIDPPRKNVKESIHKCKQAGISVIMITGDHKNTAYAIGKQIGIATSLEQVIVGEQIDKMSEEQLVEAVKSTKIFARVSPKHKLSIVLALKKLGHIVAMTGDGVNDAPAIKEADIGVSMGITGTDVTKEASKIILLDDNFTTLVNACCEGRGIYANIRKFIRYLLACNIGEVVTMFFGMIMGLPIILLPLQILLINLVTDGLPAIALGVEPTNKDVMKKPPRNPKSSVFSDGLASKIIYRGIFIGLFTLASFVLNFSISHSVDIARTAAFATLIFSQLVHVFECKSEDKGLLGIRLFDNKKLIGAVLISLIITIFVIYNPALNVLFSTCPLDFNQISIAILCSIVVPIITSIVKFRVRSEK